MAETTRFELVSPERLLLSRDVGMVVVPGGDGYFGALPRHAPMITTLNPGVIDVHEDGAVTDRIFVAGGFAEVTPERCTVLAETALALAEIDPDSVTREIGELRDELKDITDPDRVARRRRRIADLEAMLKAVEAPSPA